MNQLETGHYLLHLFIVVMRHIDDVTASSALPAPVKDSYPESRDQMTEKVVCWDSTTRIKCPSRQEIVVLGYSRGHGSHAEGDSCPDPDFSPNKFPQEGMASCSWINHSIKVLKDCACRRTCSIRPDKDAQEDSCFTKYAVFKYKCVDRKTCNRDDSTVDTTPPESTSPIPKTKTNNSDTSSKGSSLNMTALTVGITVGLFALLIITAAAFVLMRILKNRKQAQKTLAYQVPNSDIYYNAVQHPPPAHYTPLNLSTKTPTAPDNDYVDNKQTALIGQNPANQILNVAALSNGNTQTNTQSDDYHYYNTINDTKPMASAPPMSLVIGHQSTTGTENFETELQATKAKLKPVSKTKSMEDSDSVYYSVERPVLDARSYLTVLPELDADYNNDGYEIPISSQAQ